MPKDENILNMAIRKFLQEVGVTSRITRDYGDSYRFPHSKARLERLRRSLEPARIKCTVTVILRRMAASLRRLDPALLRVDENDVLPCPIQRSPGKR
jgi:hypothetical protein